MAIGRQLRPAGARRGRPPKRRTFTQALQDYLDGLVRDKTAGEDGEYRRRSRQDLLIQRLYDLAIAGSEPALRYIIDRIEGRPAETVRQIHDEPLTVVVSASRPRFDTLVEGEYEELPEPDDDADTDED